MGYTGEEAKWYPEARSKQQAAEAMPANAKQPRRAPAQGKLTPPTSSPSSRLALKTRRPSTLQTDESQRKGV
jgi:hypothetical protein